MQTLLTLLAARLTPLRSTLEVRRDGDRGSVTIEHVIWAVAFIAIAGIVVAAIQAYVTTQSGNIR